LDCPVCDKGGECELQDTVFKYGAGEGRFTGIKHHVDEKQFSPVVYYDAPRCVLCYRCVRICDEGMGVKALGVVNRGAVTEIAPNMGDSLHCDECGACIDICPVGALTSSVYRYQTRPWEMKPAGTICAHCSNGCKTTLGVRNNKIIRGNNQDRSGINGEFLCGKGRFGFDFTGHPERLRTPLAKSKTGFEPVSWAAAVQMLGERILRTKANGGLIGAIGSARTTNEENYYWQKLLREGLDCNNIDHRRSGDIAGLLNALSGRADALAKTGDVYTSKAVLIVGSDLAQQHPLLAFQARANWRHHGSRTYVVTRGPVREDQFAAKAVRAAAGEEMAGVESLAGALRSEPELVVLFGDCITGATVDRLTAFGDSLGIPVKYVCLMDYSNSRGAMDMGLAPEFLPGYRPAPETGMTLPEMLGSDDLALLWVVGANPLRRAPLTAANAWIVVQDLFLTETAQNADLVLPAASAYEKGGTVTNVCGEVQRLTRAIEVMGAKTDLEIFGLAAKELAIDLGPCTPQAVFEEIRTKAPGYGVDMAEFEKSGAAHTSSGVGDEKPAAKPELIGSAEDTLFTSGTLGRYSKSLGSVREAPGQLYGGGKR